MASRIQIAKPDIVGFFRQRPQKLYTQGDLSRILEEQRAFWRLAIRTSLSEFIGFLLQQGLQRFSVTFGGRESHCYIWGEVPLMVRLQFLRPGSYFSHFTAMQRHGLTEQTPKTIYLTQMRLNASRGDGMLTQPAIDGAFRKPSRMSSMTGEVEDYRVQLIAGGQDLGIVHQPLWDQTKTPDEVPDTIRVTDLERTLIDAAVRPVYAGGVAEVLKAYVAARERLSVNRLRAHLKALDFIYPFHQVIGFYLERAGYRENQVQLFRQLPQKFDFYLAHEMGDTDFIQAWRLYVPRGF